MVDTDVTDVIVTLERMSMEVTILVLAETKKEFLLHVCSALKLVDPLIPLIAKTAATISLSGRLNLESILPTLLSIKGTNSFIDQSHVLINARSVNAVTRSLRIIQKEVLYIETSLTNIKSAPQPTKSMSERSRKRKANFSYQKDGTKRNRTDYGED